MNETKFHQDCLWAIKESRYPPIEQLQEYCIRILLPGDTEPEPVSKTHIPIFEFIRKQIQENCVQLNAFGEVFATLNQTRESIAMLEAASKMLHDKTPSGARRISFLSDLDALHESQKAFMIYEMIKNFQQNALFTSIDFQPEHIRSLLFMPIEKKTKSGSDHSVITVKVNYRLETSNMEVAGEATLELTADT
jgi:hypothetical protein